MKVTLKLSRVGMSMQVATIAEWFKAAGSTFEKGEALYAIETDKVTQDIPAPGSGRMLEVLVKAGEEIPVGAATCIVDLTT